MPRLSYLRAGRFCWLVLILVSVSNAQEAADAPGAEAAPKPEILQAPQTLPLGQRSHGIRLDAAGRLSGLTPQAVYSVIARSARRISLGQYSAFPVATIAAAAAAGGNSGSNVAGPFTP